MIRRNGWACVGHAVVVSIFVASPTRAPLLILALALANLTIVVMLIWLGRRTTKVSPAWYFVMLAGSAGIVVLGSIVFGPLLILPIYGIGSFVAWLSLPTSRFSWFAVA